MIDAIFRDDFHRDVHPALPALIRDGIIELIKIVGDESISTIFKVAKVTLSRVVAWRTFHLTLGSLDSLKETGVDHLAINNPNQTYQSAEWQSELWGNSKLVVAHRITETSLPARRYQFTIPFFRSVNDNPAAFLALPRSRLNALFAEHEKTGIRLPQR